MNYQNNIVNFLRYQKDCYFMDIDKKIVICQNCSFYPTKEDQGEQYGLRKGDRSVKWKCRACGKDNYYITDQLIFLPQTSTIKVPYKNLINYPKKQSMKHYHIVMRINPCEQIVYQVPKNTSNIQQHFPTYNFSQLYNIKELQSLSSWLCAYRKIKKSLQKFIQPKAQNNKIVFKDDYLIFLIQHFLRAERNILRQYDTVRATIVVEIKERSFYFSIENLQIGVMNQTLHNFLLIHAMNSLNINSEQLKLYYARIIDKHSQVIQKMLEYHKTILIGVQKETYILLKEWIKDSQKVEVNFPTQVPIAGYSGSNQYRFELFPLRKDSFLSYIQNLKPKKLPSYEYYHIFCKGRRSSIQKYSFSQPYKIQQIKAIISSQYNTLNPNESQLTRTIKLQIRRKNQLDYIYLIKLVCFFMVDDKQWVILHTFNWDNIQQQKMYEFLEQPPTYLNHLSSDFQDSSNNSGSLRTPFAKKKNQISSIECISNQEQEDDDFISL